MAAQDPPLKLDAWGIPIIPVDPEALDDELGWTTADDDIDGWEPRKVTRTDFAMTFAVAGYGLLRTIVCKAGVHRRRHP